LSNTNGVGWFWSSGSCCSGSSWISNCRRSRTQITMITVSFITFNTIKYAAAPVKLLLADGTKVPSLQRYLRKKACLSNSTSRHFVDYLSIYPDFFWHSYPVRHRSWHGQDQHTYDETEHCSVLSVPWTLKMNWTAGPPGAVHGREAFSSLARPATKKRLLLS
jgi:hypothetical protein